MAMRESIREYIPAEAMEEKIRELAAEINRDYEGRELVLLCVLRGAAFFACELAKHITVPVTMDFIAVSSYGSDTESSGRILIRQDMTEPVAGRNVLVVEDIIDSGQTMTALRQLLEKKGAKDVRLCVMLDKPDRRKIEVPVDYTGFVIPNEFVVGYGLDYAQRYRNLPYIGILRLEEEA